MVMFDAITGIDWLAFFFFFIVWIGYSINLKFQGQTYNLIKVMHRYRLQWMKHMIKREDRALDLQILTSMTRTSVFFLAISTAFIIGLIAKLELGTEIFSLSNIKFYLLIGIAIFSFFKITWVIRQLNYIAVLILAAPIYNEGVDVVHDLKRQTKYINKIATILSNIDKHFISAIRATYFGIAALGWFLHPILFMLLTCIVLAVLYRREFMSRTLILLS